MDTVRDEALAIRGAGRRLARRHARPVGDGGADEVGEALQDVDADGPSAADPEAGGAVKPGLDRGIDRDRGAAGARQMGDLVDAVLVEAAILQGPELGREGPRRRLQERRQVEVVGAEAHPGLRRAARPSWSRLRTSLSTFERSSTPSASRDLEGDAAGKARQLGVVLELHDGPEQAHDHAP